MAVTSRLRSRPSRWTGVCNGGVNFPSRRYSAHVGKRRLRRSPELQYTSTTLSRVRIASIGGTIGYTLEVAGSFSVVGFLNLLSFLRPDFLLSKPRY